MRMSVPDLPLLVGLPLKFAWSPSTPWPPATSRSSASSSRSSSGITPSISSSATTTPRRSISASASPSSGTPTRSPTSTPTATSPSPAADTSYIRERPRLPQRRPPHRPLLGRPRSHLGGIVRARFAGDSLRRRVGERPRVRNHAPRTRSSLILHQSGKIEFKYRDCALGDALVGITPGNGTTGYPLDLSHGSRDPDPPELLLPPGDLRALHRRASTSAPRATSAAR